jgi:hypothetical protein
VTYRVVWRLKERRRLDVLAFLAHERGDFSNRIPRAIAEIELRLALEPNREGESRDNAERILIVPPISVTFEVFEESEVVLIYKAVRFNRRHP